MNFQVLPSLFALCERKTIDCYKQVFRVVLKFATSRGLENKFRIINQKGMFYTDFGKFLCDLHFFHQTNGI